MAKGYLQNRHMPPQDPEAIAASFVPGIIPLLDLENASVETIRKSVESVESLIKKYASISSSQLRNIYKLVKDASTVSGLNLVRPRLAYIGARQKDLSGKVVVKVIDLLIVGLTTSKLPDAQKIKGLNYILESMVAYHKFYSKEK